MCPCISYIYYIKALQVKVLTGKESDVSSSHSKPIEKMTIF